MNIDVFALCYNESLMLPHFIAHYKSMGATNITIYDNFSTDRSKEIILDSGCNYLTFDTGGQIRDDIYLSIKNECWKASKADFVCVVDIDELVEVNFDISKYNLIRTQGYDMIGLPPSRLGVANNMYSKACLFKPSAFRQIGYQPGCHKFLPQPKETISVSPETAKLLHYKYVSEDYVYQRHLMYQSRLSDFNKKYEYGKEYQNVCIEKIQDKFLDLRSRSEIVFQ